MPTIFSKIINGEIPCHKILEDDNYLSFLDVRPVCDGHALVIPKREVDYIFDIPDDELSGLMVFSKKIAHAMKKAIVCKKIGVMVAGLEVAHAHVHLIPIESVSDLSFSNAKDVSVEHLSQVVEKIKKEL